MKVTEGIKTAAQTGQKVWKAIRSNDSNHSARTKRAVIYGSVFIAGASACAIAATMYLKASAKSADKHEAWKHEDKMLDQAINDSLDASDPVAKY